MKPNLLFKIILMPVIALTLTAVLISFTITQMNALAELTTTIYDYPVQVTRAANLANVSVIKMHRSLKDVALSTNEMELQIAIAMVNKYEEGVYAQFAVMDELFLNQEGAELLEISKRLFEDWKPTRDEVISLTMEGKRDEAAAVTRGIMAFQVGILNDHMEGLKDYADLKAAEMLADVQASRARVVSSTILALIGAFLVLVIASAALTRSITVPLRELLDGVDAFGRGSLAERVKVRSSDEIGQLAQAFNSMADARHAAADELRLQSEIAAQMSEGVIISRASDGLIAYANRRFEKMFGYDQDELLGQHASVLNAPTDISPEETALKIKAVLEKKGFWRGEINNIKKDGTPFWCSASVNGFGHPEHGRVHVSVHTDISDRVRAEEALREYRAQLEARVKERTIELTAANELLRQEISDRKIAQEMALESEKMAGIGRLAAGIAHEINSPLQLVTGLSERLTRQVNQDDFQPDQFLTDLERINKNGWRIANIVRSLLTYARHAANNVDTHQLNDLIENTLFLIEHQLNTWDNITLRKELAAGLPPIRCDSNNITQVLINLLQNARDAMPPGGGEITIRTGYDGAKERFILEVINSGDPIPPQIQAKIFEPFFTTKGIGKGTGLGLSIVHGIVSAHGGEIAVESQPGDGTTFTIHLPAQPPAPASVEDSGEYSSRY